LGIWFDYIIHELYNHLNQNVSKRLNISLIPPLKLPVRLVQHQLNSVKFTFSFKNSMFNILSTIKDQALLKCGHSKIIHFYDYHIVYSTTYQVPTLYFNAYHEGTHL
jgi:hypothetical protein